MKKNRIREKKVEVFVTPEELRIIDEKAAKSKLDRSKYIRKVALEQPIINIDMSYLNDLIFEINKIGTNINQIAKHTNGYNVLYKSDIKDIQDKMEKIWDRISEVL